MGGAARLWSAKLAKLISEGAAEGGGRLWPWSLLAACGLADDLMSKRLRLKASGELACEELLR